MEKEKDTMERDPLFVIFAFFFFFGKVVAYTIHSFSLSCSKLPYEVFLQR